MSTSIFIWLLKSILRSNAPEGSAYRCIDNCSVRRHLSILRYFSIYVDGLLEEWPARDICQIHTREAHLEAITNGPFGICAWRAGNDVVDHQVVMMEFDGGTNNNVYLKRIFSDKWKKTILHGTRGEMLYDEASGSISIKGFLLRRANF